MTAPFWMYFVVAGIFFSAFMVIKTAREDRKADLEWIEKEGEVFIKRMQEEKRKKQDQDQEQQGA
ncbi:MAG: sporulation YhaL family protein [Bacillales bacterium]|nr:sporulation YhaL family protein [Bacillales bacterium]